MKYSNSSVLNITYVLLSPTFGMHQYTADLANRIANCQFRIADCHPEVHLVTTTTLPRDRYSPAVQIHAPVTTHGTGFSREGLDLAAYRRVLAALAPDPSHSTFNISHSTFHIQPPTSNLVHFTGVHAWNLPLVYALRRRGVPVIHTLHDLDPHTGVRFGPLIRLWNRLIIASGCHLLVHGRRYRDQLIAQGVPAARVTYAPLLHGFLSAAQPWPPQETGDRVQGTGVRGQESGVRGQESGGRGQESGDIVHRPSSIVHSTFTILFFGRVEAYKGADTLLAAWEKVIAQGILSGGPQPAVEGSGRLPADASFDCTPLSLRSAQDADRASAQLIIAGPVAPGVELPPLPPGVELRDRRIMDDEADALFRAAGLLALPYRDATQSALIAAAYAYGVPVIVTDVGALPEYVVEGETGWVVPPGDPAALAAVLRAALSDPARLARMGAAGRAWFDARRAEEAATLAEMYRHVSF